MREVSLLLNGRPEDYESALEAALEIMRDHWDHDEEAAVLLDELFKAFRLA